MQTHLNTSQTINLGAYYTPKSIVEITYEMLSKRLNLNDFLLLDSSCGYGDFFIYDYSYLGVDIDPIALQHVSKNIPTILTNSLYNVSRQTFGISNDQKLIIIGNPPYNDITSKNKINIKQNIVKIDDKIAHKDLGISFLRSYNILKPEYICVLHPLSYLIKKTNFHALKEFKDNYCLIDSLIISSKYFSNANTQFPIIIGLYEFSNGMDYEFIKNYTFKTIEGNTLKLNDFDFIYNYVNKYPNPKDEDRAIAYFYTLRDINALKRNKTFLEDSCNNAIRILPENLKYYYYIHHFKRFADRLPYYFGNLDVFIDNDYFLKISESFMELNSNPIIEKYFTELFGRYV